MPERKRKTEYIYTREGKIVPLKGRGAYPIDQAPTPRFVIEMPKGKAKTCWDCGKTGPDVVRRRVLDLCDDCAKPKPARAEEGDGDA